MTDHVILDPELGAVLTLYGRTVVGARTRVIGSTGSLCKVFGLRIHLDSIGPAEVRTRHRFGGRIEDLVAGRCQTGITREVTRTVDMVVLDADRHIRCAATQRGNTPGIRILTGIVMDICLGVQTQTDRSTLGIVMVQTIVCTNVIVDLADADTTTRIRELDTATT